MSFRLAQVALVVLVSFEPAVACIDRVIVRPIGALTTEDTVALEIQIVTPTAPAHLAEPTVVTINGHQILVDLYADGGVIDMIDFLIETVDLGMLPADTYTYEIVQHPTEYCDSQTVSGTFCVDEAGCQGDECQCPEPLLPTYAIISLGTLGGWTSVALAVNESGQVVGSADIASGYRHAYIWKAGAMTDLDTIPPDPQSEAWDISDAGHVVGISTVDGGIARGFLWEGAGLIDLGHLGGENTHAFGVNDFRQVTGFSWVASSDPRAFLWENGVMTDLGTLAEGVSGAWDINNATQIVGSTTVPEGEPGGAFLWEDGVMTNLGTLGGESSAAFGVNDLAQVVGWSKPAVGVPFNQAFLWEDGEMTDLGALGGFEASIAEAINNNGQVIGRDDGGVILHGFLYDDQDGMRYVRDLIDADGGWMTLNPRDINDAGQIVGSGNFNGTPLAFLMTPIDADFNDDGHTDLFDFAAFQACFPASGTGIDPECHACDINRDGEIDLADYQAYGWALKGP
jgi:probable HAF family extracellular repeat protein